VADPACRPSSELDIGSNTGAYLLGVDGGGQKRQLKDKLAKEGGALLKRMPGGHFLASIPGGSPQEQSQVLQRLTEELPDLTEVSVREQQSADKSSREL
jgi:hypothetical protein